MELIPTRSLLFMLAIIKGVGLISLLFLFLFPVQALAVAINPTANDLSVNQGGSGQTQFVITNDQNRSVTFHFDALSATFAGATDSPEFSSLPASVGLWVKIYPDIATIAPGQSQTVSLTVLPPADFLSQTLVIGVRAVGDGVEDGDVKIQEGVIGLSFVTIGVDGTTLGKLVDFSLADRHFYQSEVTFYTTITNSGRTALKPTGIITIKNIFGRTTDVLEINPSGNRIAPGQTRTLTTQWQPAWALGGYQSSLSLDSSSAITGSADANFIIFSSTSLIVLLVLVFVLISIRLIVRKKA